MWIKKDILAKFFSYMLKYKIQQNNVCDYGQW